MKKPIKPKQDFGQKSLNYGGDSEITLTNAIALADELGVDYSNIVIEASISEGWYDDSDSAVLEVICTSKETDEHFKARMAVYEKELDEYEKLYKAPLKKKKNLEKLIREANKAVKASVRKETILKEYKKEFAAEACTFETNKIAVLQEDRRKLRASLKTWQAELKIVNKEME